ncbi:MAG: hypothetical protein IJY25_03110 [Bacilli bacterium]|nr:hypothetical protein [Bacilli bacterium]
MVTDYVDELFNIIKNGFSNFVDFIIELPGLFYDLIEVIPRPFYSILYYFLSLFIFLIVIYAIYKLISTVK